MPDRLSITTADLRRLSAVADRAHWPECTEGVPHTLLQALNELVPCDQITYQVCTPGRQEFIYVQDLDPVDPCLEPDEARFQDFFWPAFWSSPVCSYPQQGADKTSVHGVSDFLTNSEFSASAVGELFRVQQSRYNLLVPLSFDGETDVRIELWRRDGPDFGEREHLLLGLLRPHLSDLDRANRARRAAAPLTPRQAQLLRHVATGLTNRQVARAMSISEGTVRRHLENIYARLDVTSRTAAAALLSTDSSART